MSRAGQAGVAARIQVITQARQASDQASSAVSRAILETGTLGSDQYGKPLVIAEGDKVDLPGGARLRVADISEWVRVSLANDWSVPWIYGILALITIGLSIALLVPSRRATVMIAEQDGVWCLVVSTWHSSKSPSFRSRVVDALRTATQEAQ